MGYNHGQYIPNSTGDWHIFNEDHWDWRDPKSKRHADLMDVAIRRNVQSGNQCRKLLVLQSSVDLSTPSAETKSAPEIENPT